MHARSLYGNREVSGSTEGSTGLTVRGGKAGAVATDARFGEVRLCHSSCEAAEQCRAAGSGGGGAKGRGQGKRGPAKHVPDPEPEARDPGAEPRTASCKAQEERAVHRASPLLHHLNVDTLRTAFLALKRKAAPGVDGVTWQDYEADLEPNLEDLHREIHRGAYRPQPSRRTYIPRRMVGKGRWRSQHWRTRSSRAH